MKIVRKVSYNVTSRIIVIIIIHRQIVMLKLAETRSSVTQSKKKNTGKQYYCNKFAASVLNLLRDMAGCATRVDKKQTFFMRCSSSRVVRVRLKYVRHFLYSDVTEFSFLFQYLPSRTIACKDTDKHNRLDEHAIWCVTKNY